MTDEEGRSLITTIQISPTTIRKRAQELWLDVVKKGSVFILPPAAIISNSQTFSTPGTFNFTVPAGVTLVSISCYGGGGGGGGGALHTILGPGTVWASGSAGGNGGLAIYVLDTSPGQTLSVTVGVGGAGGTYAVKVNANIVDAYNDGHGAVGADGYAGGASFVQRSGITYCQGNGGQRGYGGQANKLSGATVTFPKGADGSGQGQSVTTGAGSPGGNGGNGNPIGNGADGSNGKVVLEW